MEDMGFQINLGYEWMLNDQDTFYQSWIKNTGAETKKQAVLRFSFEINK